MCPILALETRRVSVCVGSPARTRSNARFGARRRAFTWPHGRGHRRRAPGRRLPAQVSNGSAGRGRPDWPARRRESISGSKVGPGRSPKLTPLRSPKLTPHVSRICPCPSPSASVAPDRAKPLWPTPRVRGRDPCSEPDAERAASARLGSANWRAPIRPLAGLGARPAPTLDRPSPCCQGEKRNADRRGVSSHERRGVNTG